MSIDRLRQIAEQTLPLNISDGDEVDEVRVLMAAGLVAALPLRTPAGYGHEARVIRVLAITSDGRRLLRRNAAEPSPATVGS